MLALQLSLNVMVIKPEIYFQSGPFFFVTRVTEVCEWKLKFVKEFLDIK